MNKAVIFDLDGVIVDTAEFHYRGWKRLADQLGVKFDEAANEKLRGIPRRESLIAMLGYTPTEDKIKEYSDQKNEYYLKLVQTLKPKDLLPGVKALLPALKKAGYKIALASSSKNARLVLKLVGLSQMFHAVVDGNEIVKGKPNPELFLKAAQRLGVEPVNCLVVEDAESGIEAAVAAGMHTLGVGKPESMGFAQRVVANLSQIDLPNIARLIEGQALPADPLHHPPLAVTNDKTWIVTEKGFDQKRQAWRESLFSLGNGYMGVRGSVEENDLPFPDSRPGTFVSGVFDIYADWYQTIVNLPYYFTTRFTLGGEVFSMTRGKVKNYIRTLDMYRGLLTRTFVWQDTKGRETEFKFERLVSMAELHLAALRVTFKPLNWGGAVTIDNVLDGEVDNIDFHKSGYQLRKERYYFVDVENKGAFGENSAYLQVKTKTNPYKVAEAIRVAVASEGKAVAAKTSLVKDEKQVSRRLSLTVAKGKTYNLDKMIGVAASRDGLKGTLANTADAFASSALARGFERVVEDHATAWCARWRSGDIVIDGHAGDQQATRFSIFHLTQFVNPNDNKVNIGSRGLTAEMHYGNCFWDTELFIIPYYIYTWPKAARALMEYRYQTLPEARNKAKRLFFKGAMFPWMSSFPGKEQADYWEYANIAVHIVGDIHYALEHYRNASGDEEFVEKYGAEIILETARFWQSRCHYSETRKKYIMVTVKGPNEYDGVVNNNTYTNWQAKYNLLSAVKLARTLKKDKPALWKSLSTKLKLAESEITAWEKTGKDMFINYDAKKKLFIEDDCILDKMSFNMKELKPGKQIITERGVSWDTLLRLKIVKQADVLLMMSLFPDAFTREQKLAAWKFYEPITCHDSSLSPCTHAMIAAQLDMPKEAMAYWDQNARLDLDDLMDNSFLGVHSACVGGTWQIVVLGFAGMRLRENGFSFEPRVPKRWKGIQFTLHHKNRVLQVNMTHTKCSFTLTPGAKSALVVTVGQKNYTVKPGQTVDVAYKN